MGTCDQPALLLEETTKISHSIDTILLLLTRNKISVSSKIHKNVFFLKLNSHFNGGEVVFGSLICISLMTNGTEYVLCVLLPFV